MGRAWGAAHSARGAPCCAQRMGRSARGASRVGHGAHGALSTGREARGAAYTVRCAAHAAWGAWGAWDTWDTWDTWGAARGVAHGIRAHGARRVANGRGAQRAVCVARMGCGTRCMGRRARCAVHEARRAARSARAWVCKAQGAAPCPALRRITLPCQPCLRCPACPAWPALPCPACPALPFPALPCPVWSACPACLACLLALLALPCPALGKGAARRAAPLCPRRLLHNESIESASRAVGSGLEF